MMLRQAHSISWKVLEGTFCGSEALCVTEQMDLPRWGMSWLIWEEVCHSYTEAADAGDVVVGKRKSPKGYVSNEHQRQ